MAEEYKYTGKSRVKPGDLMVFDGKGGVIKAKEDDIQTRLRKLADGLDHAPRDTYTVRISDTLLKMITEEIREGAARIDELSGPSLYEVTGKISDDVTVMAYGGYNEPKGKPNGE